MFIMNHIETMEAPKLIIVNSLKKENNKYHSQCNTSTNNKRRWATPEGAQKLSGMRFILVKVL